MATYTISVNVNRANLLGNSTLTVSLSNDQNHFSHNFNSKGGVAKILMPNGTYHVGATLSGSAPVNVSLPSDLIVSDANNSTSVTLTTNAVTLSLTGNGIAKLGNNGTVTSIITGHNNVGNQTYTHVFGPKRLPYTFNLPDGSYFVSGSAKTSNRYIFSVSPPATTIYLIGGQPTAIPFTVIATPPPAIPGNIAIDVTGTNLLINGVSARIWIYQGSNTVYGGTSGLVGASMTISNVPSGLAYSVRVNFHQATGGDWQRFTATITNGNFTLPPGLVTGKAATAHVGVKINRN